MNKRIFSGIQPSGNLHLGNYLGAIKNWVKLQDEFDSIFCVVDLHAITVPQDPEALRKKTLEIAKIYLAAGIDPKKSSIFIQSHIPEHSELAWILNTIVKNGDLTKMTQFKSKANFDEDAFEIAMGEKADEDRVNFLAAKGIHINEDANPEEIFNIAHKITLEAAVYAYKDKVKKPFNNIGVGLFDYPVLMAADIILYNTEVVPVGKDQLQHIELTRTLAERFNKKFGETFIIPKAYTVEEGQNIMGLDDPSKKMSKSAKSEYNYIALTDSEEIIRKKIKKAVTDSGSEIVYRDDKPALKNLINIYSMLLEKTPQDIEKMYADKQYSDFKTGLADTIVNFLQPLQEKISAISDQEVLEILKDGAAKVRPLAQQKLNEVKQKLGFIV